MINCIIINIILLHLYAYMYKMDYKFIFFYFYVLQNIINPLGKLRVPVPPINHFFPLI